MVLQQAKLTDMAQRLTFEQAANLHHRATIRQMEDRIEQLDSETQSLERSLGDLHLTIAHFQSDIVNHDEQEEKYRRTIADLTKELEYARSLVGNHKQSMKAIRANIGDVRELIEVVQVWVEECEKAQDPEVQKELVEQRVRKVEIEQRAKEGSKIEDGLWTPGPHQTQESQGRQASSRNPKDSEDRNHSDTQPGFWTLENSKANHKQERKG